jgi:hypothetical protein
MFFLWFLLVVWFFAGGLVVSGFLGGGSFSGNYFWLSVVQAFLYLNKNQMITLSQSGWLMRPNPRSLIIL